MFILLLGIYCLTLSAQQNTKFFNNSNRIKKGTILLNNGSRVKYTNLTTAQDSVFFADSKSFYSRLSLSNIEQITRTKSSVGMDILIGGVSGLFTGLLVGSLVYPDRTFGEWFVDQISKVDHEQEITKDESKIIVIGALSGIAIGALVGLTKKKEKVIYQKKTTIDVFPGLTSFNNQDIGLTVTVKISLE